MPLPGCLNEHERAASWPPLSLRGGGARDGQQRTFNELKIVRNRIMVDVYCFRGNPYATTIHLHDSRR